MGKKMRVYAQEEKNTIDTITIDSEACCSNIEFFEELNVVRNQVILVIVKGTGSEGGISQPTLGQEWQKCFWHKTGTKDPGNTLEQFLSIYEASEDQIGFPGDTTTSTSPWPELWQEPEEDLQSWRGVFAPVYKRKAVFTKTMSFKTSELPRWKPNVVIDRRTLELADE
ncbi:MAG: hypothetical protein HY730_09130 [Candidatus Tectomicrobia bacterium]|uniref:Uncharacterized protein n=1 Tax=Tectimicrobiota bacterium TaxID=2528274 RepID=A0A933GMU4_UNCTE|nr:hypothetical protein [Candidatus Tectomicrobia bacterium]